MSDAITLVVGLGNPGSKYRRTYHNVGFMALDALDRKFGARQTVSDTDRGRLREFSARAPVNYYGRPATYVNESGKAVSAWVDKLDLDSDQVLVVYDDLDLDVGRVRLRPSGSAGGHNGVKSIINVLGSDDFPRLRVGIGPLPRSMSPSEFVLSKVQDSDWQVFSEIFTELPGMLEMILSAGLNRAMDRWNGVDFCGRS